MGRPYDIKFILKSLQQYAVVYRVERCTQITQHQQNQASTICTAENIIKYTENSCLGTVPKFVCRRRSVKKIVHSSINKLQSKVTPKFLTKLGKIHASISNAH